MDTRRTKFTVVPLVTMSVNPFILVESGVDKEKKLPCFSPGASPLSLKGAGEGRSGKTLPA